MTTPADVTNRAGRGPGAPQDSAAASTTLSLLQFTDLHLFGDPEGRLLGQRTADTFAAVLELAMAQHWPPDAILLTGDLVHDADPGGYQRLRRRMNALGLPWFSLPGNHDQLPALARHLDPRAATPMQTYSLGGWTLVLLDSTVPGQEGGHLPADLLVALDRHLAAHPDRPTLVSLHHHPVPMGSPWIDCIPADNGADLLALAGRHPHLRGLLWGHVHQTFEARQGHTALLGTPSTCVQFMPRTEDFTLDPQTPGYRWLRLHPDGRIDSDVVRIAAYPEPLGTYSTGY